ncbi:glycoside hydrolase family 15 protein [Prauserella muralis]|uniref:Glycoside hydrolase n=1 Tax=Prauserella muralis TaxID=588067 RepID=A0A2V4ANB9_9PSEU|nr:glycoside hydrolase family 15 protein [Prauserella muralis]PXY22183.1 glycoside hydrolase [Prauserella muralis]TWE27792.1 GH15 family glucan-1,4-alpha-glucosidase [Prauserella muralis]
MTPGPHVLRDYALLADGERGALIGQRGEIVWLCAPRWDSESVFARLLGGHGHYTIRPADPWFVPGGFYEDGSLIWRSRWRLSGGAIESREAMALPGGTGRLVLLRQVHALDGDAEVDVALDPRSDFGREPMRELARDDGVWHARLGGLYLRWSGCPEAKAAGPGLAARMAVPGGSTHDFVLEISERPFEGPPPDPDRAWEVTEHKWRAEVPRLDGVIGDRDARLAYAVHRGMTSDHGGVVAAATTSLPERARAGRNYDYRYTWIRDQSYAAQALAAAGDDRLFDRHVDWLVERLLADGASLRPVYTVSGDPVPPERPIEGLPGYPGGVPKTGNRAGAQFQLDALGEVLLVLAAAGRRGRLDSTRWQAVETAVSGIEKRWGEPDAGVWELEDDHWAHSRLICASGLRAIAAVEPGRGDAASWSALADAIVADAASDCLHPDGRWQRSPHDPRVDAALLLPAIRGGVPAQDPRSTATLQAVREQLTEDGYVYRFRHDERPLHAAEGAFLLCGFFTALACLQQGEVVEARGWFERSRAACGPPGLYAEEYDVVQHQLRGNLPQLFVHALMLQASCALTRT